MNHPSCSAPDLDLPAENKSVPVVMCVFHLIAGVGVAFTAIGAAALFGLMR